MLPGEVGSVQGLEAEGGPGRPGSPTAGWKPGRLSARGAGCGLEWGSHQAAGTWGAPGLTVGVAMKIVPPDHSSTWGWEGKRVCKALGLHRMPVVL